MLHFHRPLNIVPTRVLRFRVPGKLPPPKPVHRDSIRGHYKLSFAASLFTAAKSLVSFAVVKLFAQSVTVLLVCVHGL
ncbi:hypothetical protein CEXT_151361 [Caerostris extrusa]|uniref:Uncharacterized protein n=1 Tax=Caerostris extrusa TaxID=172846 RepID=A0AAV4M6Y6_CAEEX|nr:hypothetical protein CEXT_151361 [Caerostris extrusa]